MKDISDIIGKENKNTGEVKRMPVKDARTFSYIPGIGKFYYWWYGGGRTKTEKARAKKGKD